MVSLTGVPAWIQLAKSEVQQSDNWISFTKLLFDILNAELKESGIRSFATLSIDEKKLLVSKAVNALKSEAVYKKLFDSLSTNLDLQFSSEIKRNLNSKHESALSDKIFEEFHVAIEAMLAKWPELQNHFGRCINTLLTPRLRYALWCSKLQSAVIKQEYLDLVKSNPKRMVSKYDLEIAQKCKVLIESDETLEVLRDIKQSVTVLRHMLSYHQERSGSNSNMTDLEYLIAVPFVYCSLAPKNRLQKSGQQAAISAEELARMVEQFEVFWKSRPAYASNIDDGASLNSFIKKVVNILKAFDSELLEKVIDIYSKSFPATIANPIEALKLLLQPCLRCFYVSYLPLESVLFVFDQILIGFEIEDYDPMPHLTSTILYLIRSDLKQAETWRQIETTFNKKLKFQHSETIQSIMREKRIGEELEVILERNSIDKSIFSFTSSSFFSDLPPWKHWYSEKLVDHFQKVLKKNSTPQISSTSVSLPSNELEKITPTKPEASVIELEIEKNYLVEQIDLMKRELEESQKSLHEERSAKFEFQKQSDIEINKLRQKLADFERANVLTPPLPLVTGATRVGLTEPEYEESETTSLRGLVPPPPSISPSVIYQPITPDSRQADQVSQVDPEEPDVVDAPIEQVDDKASKPTTPMSGASVMLRDLINRFAHGYNEIAHGSGVERLALNNQTRTDLANVRKAYELAKTKLKGRPISDEEIKALPENERKIFTSELSQATKAQLLKMKIVNT